LTALSVGKRFRDTCVAGQKTGVAAKVLSVYNNSVNILMQGEIFSVVTVQAGRSPSGLTVDNVSCLGLTPGETCSLLPGRISFPRAVIDYSGSVLWQGRISEKFRSTLSYESVMALKSALDRKAPPCSIWSVGPETRPVREVRRLGDDPYNAVRGLTGLGPGLTPSGDDVLLGFLSVLNHFSNDEGYKNRFRAAVSETTDFTTTISAQLLKNALRFEYHEYIEDAISALSQSHEGLVPAAGRLFGLGATSGADIAAGMYFAAEIIKW